MFQQCMIIGNLGSDPEMRYTEDGTAVTNMNVAVNKKWDGGEKTWWFKVTCWRRLAETTNQYLKKGRRVMVIGEISASAWSDKEGNARASLDLNAREVKFLGSKDEAADSGSNSPPSDTDHSPMPPEQEEDLPF